MLCPQCRHDNPTGAKFCVRCGGRLPVSYAICGAELPSTSALGQLAVHGGFEVKSQGGGCMIAFQRTRRALLSAIAIQRAFAAYTTT
jgi:hypothetical protein